MNVTLSSAGLANMDAALAKLQVHGERVDEKSLQDAECV